MGWPRMSVMGEGPGEGRGAEIKPTWKFRLIGGRRVRNLPKSKCVQEVDTNR